MVSIMNRYGLNNGRFSASLFSFVQLMIEYGIVPTLPVTAIVLDRYPNLFKRIQDMGVEFAVHGYKHVDYTQLESKRIVEHLQRAVEIFDKHGIPWSGFRFPFLRCDEERIDMLSREGFQWDSSRVISWNHLKSEDFTPMAWQAFQNILNTYRPMNADDCQTLPAVNGGLIEIPVSIPDDDMLIERLGIKNSHRLTNIWNRMLSEIRKKGELFVLQVHPERFFEFRMAVERLIHKAAGDGDVWFTSLEELTDWWREREEFRFDIAKVSKKRFRIRAECSDRATVLFKNGNNHIERNRFGGNESIVDDRVWEIQSPAKPIIGIGSNTPADVVGFIGKKGYAYGVSGIPEDFNCYIDCRDYRGRETEKDLTRRIEDCPYPLLRFWRWPDKARYAFAVTGDIDGVDLRDFWERFHG
jgi:peptidoglycan/xylan/chitin deacetylase (PgdA/CDA1 family)